MDKKKSFKRKLDGIVISEKNEKTIVIKVVRRFKHAKYSKFVYESKKYHAHDEKNEAREGDNVTVIASRPHSKQKRWELFSVNR
ncbi:MAG: 30S ribosomal protein S17 [Bacteriovoracaceae bacterium]|nr:30S ribosomal protein S17 [Bacteriovoracaceae bacterium]